MPDIMAIISKAVFEKDAKRNGKLASLGDVVPLDRYNSANKGLDPLKAGGRLFLVTVRPPDEQLWLVAVLHDPKPGDAAWIAAEPSAIPMTNVAHLRGTLRFESGKGLSQDKGALGMSLQTPRALAPEDMEAILAALAGPGDALAKMAAALPASVSAATREIVQQIVKDPEDETLRERGARRLAAEGAGASAKVLLAPFKHLNQHEKKVDPRKGDLPCLCKKCIASAPAEVDALGLAFGRDFVCAQGRILHFWAPKDVLADATDTQSSVRMSLVRQIRALAKARKQRAKMRSR